MSKNSLVITIVLLIAILTGGGLYFWQNSADEDAAVKEQIPYTTIEVTAEGDVADEIIDSVLITRAFASKYNKNEADIAITIVENDGTYASGEVSFAGEMGGGWWLAFKEYDSWIIVADGNGTVMCADVEPYDFPVSMVPECWDEATAELVTF